MAQLQHRVARDRASPEQQKCLDMVAQSSYRLCRHLNNALIHSEHTYRRASGGATAGREWFSPLALVRRVIEDVRPLLSQRKTRLRWFLHGVDQLMTDSLRDVCEGTMLFGRRQQLRMALLNPLHNAISFAPLSGDVVLITALVKEGHRASCLGGWNSAGDSLSFVFQVVDSGDGVPDRGLDILWEPFWQYNSTSTRSHSGQGLGLTVTKVRPLWCGLVEAGAHR